MKKIILLCLSGLFLTSLLFSQNQPSGDRYQSGLLKTDYQKLVSRADLIYEKPVTLGQAGMPIGNGRMGSMIWTSPTALKMQINRVDVFGINNATNSFWRRHSEYANGCGFVDLHLVDYGEDVFTTPDFSQHLEVYDGLITTQGKDISTRTLAWNEHDVMAVDVNDKRQQPTNVSIDLRMLRYQEQFFYDGENFVLAKNHAVKFQTNEHFVTSTLNIKEGRIILKQVFEEGNHYNASAVAISIIGRESMARYLNRSTVQLTAAAGQGQFTLLIASASSFDREVDIEALALKELAAAENEGFTGMLESNKTWWHDYWSKAFIDLHSEDGKADNVEMHYTWFLYLMGSSSLGDYPPRFINSIWSTTGDNAHWGSQFWWWNQSAWHNPLMPMNRFELSDPLFNQYSKHLDSYALCARQQWGSKGVYFPETTFFDGFEELPEDIAAEMRDLYLVRKPWEERSQRFKDYIQPKIKHNSRYNWAGTGYFQQGHWIIQEKGNGPFGHVTHSLSATGKIAFLYWKRYQYTMDESWLREYAYPVIRGAVEFYRNFPNMRKDENGKYNIHHVNYDEEVWDVQNSIEDMAAMHGMIPILIRASEILNEDADMRPVWKEFAENLADFPSNKDLSGPLAEKPKYWINGIPPARFGNAEAVNLEQPAVYYDLLTIATEDKEMIRVAKNTYHTHYSEGIDENTIVPQNDRSPVVAAYLGLGEDIKFLLPNQIISLNTDQFFTDTFGPGIMPNRISLQSQIAMDFERYGNNAHILHTALLQSVPPAPGKDPVIYLFPAWPEEWDATYTLAARGAFLVTTTIRKGEIGWVEIQSNAGGVCKLSNPWTDKTVDLYRNGEKVEEMSGSLIVLPTQKGEIIQIVPKDAMIPPKAIPFEN